MEYYIVGAFILLISIALISSMRKSKRESVDAKKESLDRIFNQLLDNAMLSTLPPISFGEDDTEHRLHTLEHKTDLLLENFGLEYRIEPAIEAKPVLVKKTKDK